MKQALQTALRVIYPARCLLCDERVESEFGLCGSCWSSTSLISGVVCDQCGTSLPGQDQEDGLRCDDCLRIARPWSKGRAGLLYQDNGRKLVLALKHGDRHEIVRPAARWLAQAAQPLLDQNTLIVPIPLYWSRMLRRRFNQSALLAQALGREVGLEFCPDYLLRRKRTPSLDGMGVEDRFKTLREAITVHPARAAMGAGRPILLVDDVMTSGATFAAAAEACLSAKASRVSVLALARVTKAP